MYKRIFKRPLDILLSFLLLILLFPILLVTVLCLYFVNRGSGVFFLQERPGKDAKLFKIVKFKTMTDECDDNGNLLPDTLRLTKIGKLIRSLSLDELPQLLNVIKGDMSIIGPRPLLPKYLPLYSKEQTRRHEVRPGITGWAQCHGRNGISWKEKFELDVWYVDHLTFWTDLLVLFATIKKVVNREGINQTSVKDGHLMEPFNGNN